MIVLTTPDANRTFLSYLGTPQEVQLDSAVADAVCGSRIVAVEGYIWETPSAIDQIQKVSRFSTAYALHLKTLSPSHPEACHDVVLLSEAFGPALLLSFLEAATV